MSCSLWRYTEACEGRPCPGDCDCCDFDPDEVTITPPMVDYKWEELEQCTEVVFHTKKDKEAVFIKKGE